MTTYDDIVRITKKYFGFTAQFFVNGILIEIKKTEDTFAKEDIPEFASKIPRRAGRSLPMKKRQAYIKEVMKLAG